MAGSRVGVVRELPKAGQGLTTYEFVNRAGSQVSTYMEVARQVLGLAGEAWVLEDRQMDPDIFVSCFEYTDLTLCPKVLFPYDPRATPDYSIPE